MMILSSQSAVAATGDVLFTDDFESGFGQWTTTDANLSGINSMTASSASNSLFVRGDTVTTTSSAFDTRVPGIRIQMWIRRGSDSFSEDPDNGEDIVVEYFDASGSWIALATHAGSGTNGEIISLDQTIGGDALHAAFQLRIRLTLGNGGPPVNRGVGWDYWHVDDISIAEAASPVDLTLGTCEEFDAGLGNWMVAPATGRALTGTHTANTAPNSLAINGGTVSVTSPTIPLSKAANLQLSLWIRRGDDSFSEDPDRNEDLVVEYLNRSLSWIELGSFAGDGIAGQVYAPNYTLPSAAAHTDFKLRLRMEGGSGVEWDYWHVDSICLSGESELAEWRFEEESWNGTTGEVEDSSGNGHAGTAAGGAMTGFISPAIAGDPGTCGYADLDGLNDGIDIPHSDGLHGIDALTYTIWVRPESYNKNHHIMGKETGGKKGKRGKKGGRGGGSQMAIRFTKNNLEGRVATDDGEKKVKTPLPTVGQWAHIGLVFDGRSLTLFVDGREVVTETFSSTTLRDSTTEFAIGRKPGSNKDPFDGFLDEARVYALALSQTEIVDVMNETHVCSVSAVQFLIGHDANGVNCSDEPISVTARDLSGNTLTTYAGTITLDTQTGTGSWALVSGAGTFADATSDDGLASYQFSTSDLGLASFALTYTNGAETFNIDVYDGASRDDDSEGDITFAPSAVTITANALSNPPPSPINDPIGTQIAGTAFNLHLAAFGTTPSDATCGIIETYEGTKDLRFWIDHNDPNLAPLVPMVDLNPISSSEAGAAIQSVVFTAGQAVVTAKYKDTGRITIHTLENSGASEIRGSTGAFVSQPADFFVLAVENSSGVANPGVQTPTGSPWARAGEALTLRVDVRDSEGSRTPSYGKESVPEGILITSSNLVAPAGGRNGTANDGAIENGTAFSAILPDGTFAGSTFAFDEVGAIRLVGSIGDGDFLGSGNVIGSPSGVVGRFAPSRFAIVANAPRFDTQCGVGAFTWMGQPFGYVSGDETVWTVSAVNVAGAVTANYTGSWWRLTNDSLSNRAYTSDTGTIDETNLPGTDVDPAINENGDGTGTLTFSSGTGLVMTRTSPIAPFDVEIQLALDVIDEDGTVYPLNPFTVGGLAAGTGIPFDVSKRFQFGRVRLENAHGSELVALPMNLRAQRFDGNVFINDDNDSCSVLSTAILGLSPTPPSLSTTPTLGNIPLLSGNAALVLSAPNADGSVDIIADLSPSGANLPWLQYDWPEDGNLDGLFDDNPRARATFGIWSGREQLIYLREVY